MKNICAVKNARTVFDSLTVNSSLPRKKKFTIERSFWSEKEIM